MKTIINTEGVIERVEDSEAEFKVRNQRWKYIPKQQWKESIRPKAKITPVEIQKLVEQIAETVLPKKKYQKPKKS